MQQAISHDESAAQDEAQIRALAQEWSKAPEARDVDGLLAGYEPDAVLFDVKPPYRVDGIDAIRRMWEACLPCFPEKYRSERHDFKVTVSGDAAFAHGLHRIRPIGEELSAGGTWIRVTICYRRIRGQWKVVHEHVSLPFDSATGEAVTITDESFGLS
jgi:uncharacterized protein (TIGR02246 family)